MSETTTSTAAAVPSQRRPQDLADHAAQATIDAFGQLFSHAPAARMDSSGGLLRMRTGVPLPPFNGVMCASARPDAGDVLAAVDEFVGGEVPWNVQLRPGYPSELDGELAGRGLVVTGEIPLMVLTDPGRLPEAGDVAMRPAVSYEDVTAVLELLEAGFGMPPEISRRSFPVAGLIGSGCTSWIATAGGADVSTAYDIVADGAIGIFNVATPAEHRGKGYGGLVTAQAVRAGLAAGGSYAYLQASPMGHPVYERLGFVTVERWRQWMPAQLVAHD